MKATSQNLRGRPVANPPPEPTQKPKTKKTTAKEAIGNTGLIAGGIALEKAMTQVPPNQVPPYVPETGYFLGFALIFAGAAKAIRNFFK
jgi:hypothetical protein